MRISDVVLGGEGAIFRRMATSESSKVSGGDPLARMRAYQVALALVKLAWVDAERVKHHRVTRDVASQLDSAVGSIGANLAEGYSRSSGGDRARIFEYALGSAREAEEWYRCSLPVLGDDIVAERLEMLAEIKRILPAVIPRERDRLIRPKPAAGG